MESLMLKPRVIFETKNFIVRQCEISDKNGYLAFWDDPQVMQYIGDGTWGGGEKVIEQVIQKNLDFYKIHPHFGFWAVIDKETGGLVGEAGLSIVEETGEIEAGYILRQSYWGKGLGTELLNALIQYGFQTLNLEEIMAVAHPENAGSIRIMQKCGMQYCGTANYHNRLSVKYLIKNPNEFRS